MEKLSVRMLMSSTVITIEPYTRLPEIRNLMRVHQIRHVPVVDHDKLVGIVTLGDVRNAVPSSTSTLNLYELSCMLNTVTAGEIMRTGVITVAPSTPLADAARLLLTNKIGGLPVIESNELVGMITASDLFRAVMEGQVAMTSSGFATPTANAEPRLRPSFG